MAQIGVIEVLLSLASDPDLLGSEHQRPAMLALVNLACEHKNLTAMTQAGTLDVIVMLLATPAVADSDQCLLVLKLLLAYTAADPQSVDSILLNGLPVSLIHFFMTHVPPSSATEIKVRELYAQAHLEFLWVSQRTIT